MTSFWEKTTKNYESDEVRILISRHYAKIAEKYKALAPAVLGLTKDENNTIDAFLTDWSLPEALNLWKQMLRGEGEVSNFYCDVLARIHSTVYDFDTIVTWSTNGAVSKFCRQRGINHVMMEQGCVRGPIYDSIYVDALGVNGGAISRQLQLENHEPRYTLSQIRSMLPTKTQKGQHIDAAHKPIASASSEIIYSNLGKNVLIALQLKDDSNCQIYSDYDSMHELLHEILPPLVAAGKMVYIKPHPAAKDRKINLEDHQMCQIYIELFDDNVVWLDDIKQNEDYISLLCKMDWVVTVNSSTAFEAMIYERPVVVLGEAPYKFGTFWPTIDTIVNNTLDRKAYLHEITKIVDVMIYSYLVPQPFAFEYSHFVDNLRTAIKLKETLRTQGPAALTALMIRTPERLSFDISDKFSALRVLDKRFSETLRGLGPTPVLAPVPIKPPAARETRTDLDRLQRKLTKLRRDPAKFLVDSQNPLLSTIGSIIGGRK